VKRLSKWIALGAGAVALGGMLIAVACGTASSSTGVTEMRVVHLSPDEQNLDLLIDNKVVLSNIAYGVPTAFASITAVNHDLKLNLTGAPTNVLDNPTESFTKNTSYTYLVVGYASSGGGIRANKLTDDHTLADKGMFKLRVVNGSPNAGPVDVYVVTPGTDYLDPTVKPTMAGVASNAASTYQSLASGSYHIIITAGNDKNAVLVQLDGTNGTGVPSFQAGQNRTLIMLNQVPQLPGGSPYTTLPLLADLN
jgi:hypothetical protein